MLAIGSAGVPLSTKKHSSLAGIARIRELGLDAMELEFVRGVRMSPTLAREIRKAAQEHKVKLTVHAPYYINLNSIDAQKLKDSKKRILQSARIGKIAGATSVTFHPAYFGKKSLEETYEFVKKQLLEIVNVLKKEGNDIQIALETVGKLSQFAGFENTVKLSAEIRQVWPCIDWAHVYARSNGKYNSKKEFEQMLNVVKKECGKSALKHLHMHISGINFTAKGERNHVNLKNTNFKYKELMQVLKAKKVSGILISESPNIEKDALMLKEIFKNI